MFTKFINGNVVLLVYLLDILIVLNLRLITVTPIAEGQLWKLPDLKLEPLLSFSFFVEFLTRFKYSYSIVLWTGSVYVGDLWLGLELWLLYCCCLQPDLLSTLESDLLSWTSPSRGDVGSIPPGDCTSISHSTSCHPTVLLSLPSSLDYMRANEPHTQYTSMMYLS